MVVELVVQAVVWATIASASITAIVQATLSAHNRKALERPQPRAELDPAMRDEIEQNERWWLKSFHNLLEESGAPELVRVPGEWSEDRYGSMRQRRDYVALVGCICPKCTYALKKSKEQPKIPLHNGNPYVIRELQTKLHVQADGIIGPATMRAIERNRPEWHADLTQSAWALYFELKIPELSGVVEQYRKTAELEAPRGVTSVSRGGVTMNIHTPSYYKRQEKIYGQKIAREIEYWKSVA
ncbi:hypothetical protein SEA_A3WALLY_310 [Microbacterium phage A3Wally]|nr:hypothetical protein SEA_A3WALLY_310 [Microbacterium phage A3Wally]